MIGLCVTSSQLVYLYVLSVCTFHFSFFLFFILALWFRVGIRGPLLASKELSHQAQATILNLVLFHFSRRLAYAFSCDDGIVPRVSKKKWV